MKNFQLEQWIGLQLPGECVMYTGLTITSGQTTALHHGGNKMKRFHLLQLRRRRPLMSFFSFTTVVLGGGLSDWLTYKWSLTKSLKIFLMFFSSSSDLQKNLFLFFFEWKKEEKRRVSELENGVCVPGIQTIWTPARRRSLIVIVGVFFPGSVLPLLQSLRLDLCKAIVRRG